MEKPSRRREMALRAVHEGGASIRVRIRFEKVSAGISLWKLSKPSKKSARSTDGSRVGHIPLAGHGPFCFLPL